MLTYNLCHVNTKVIIIDKSIITIVDIINVKFDYISINKSFFNTSKPFKNLIFVKNLVSDINYKFIIKSDMCNVYDKVMKIKLDVLKSL